MESDTTGSPDNDKAIATGRLEAFSDGVFSVAITLLVLNIQVPHLKDLEGPTTVARELLKQWPAYVGYVISFFTIGIVWANHHRTFAYIARTDHSLLMLNVFLMMTVTLIPFTTSLLSEYIQQPAEQQTVAFVYALGWLLVAITYNLLWQYAMRKPLVDPQLTPTMLREIARRTMMGPLFYAVAVVAALFNAALSVFICLALAVYFLIPNGAFSSRRRSRA